MQEIRTMEWEVLIDTLSDQTAIYTKLLAERNRTLDFENAKKMIKLIQAEVALRQTIPVKSLVKDSNTLQEQKYAN